MPFKSNYSQLTKPNNNVSFCQVQKHILLFTLIFSNKKQIVSIYKIHFFYDNAKFVYGQILTEVTKINKPIYKKLS